MHYKGAPGDSSTPHTSAAIAARTAGSYAVARREHHTFQARRAAALLAGNRSAIAIPDGNLLAGAAS